MGRLGITAEEAFVRLREQSQHNGNKLSAVAAAVVDSHLLPAPPIAASPAAERRN